MYDDSVIPRKDVPWYRVYEFVFDRLRAVRQDMVIQRIGGNTAIRILECSVWFLIYAGYRLGCYWTAYVYIETRKHKRHPFVILVFYGIVLGNFWPIHKYYYFIY